MSAVFAPNTSSFINPTSMSVQRLLDENDHIIQLIAELSRKGNLEEAAQMQLILQRNIIHLVSMVDHQKLAESTATALPDGSQPPENTTNST
ncbi:SSXT protein [Opisthorchis viverrini]|uniref:SSXT protein n=1 Tax=Opisthorchis viverrini TaxID=6198 RepID=A0A1S8WJM9_OPIVI|nr:SSXT protein [Opisthorchis viverrini]